MNSGIPLSLFPEGTCRVEWIALWAHEQSHQS
jgi:hypothetical protein